MRPVVLDLIDHLGVTVVTIIAVWGCHHGYRYRNPALLTASLVTVAVFLGALVHHLRTPGRSLVLSGRGWTFTLLLAASVLSTAVLLARAVCIEWGQPTSG